MSKSKRSLVILSAFLFPLLLCSESESSGMGLTSNITSRTFLIKFKNDYGTAFTIEVNNRQYLITARHVVEGIGDKGTIFIFHDSVWKPLEVKVIYCDEKDIDIVVLIPPFQLSPTLEIKTTNTGAMIGQDVYFLGFPYEWYSDFGFKNKFPFPFVKKGILSAVQIKPDVLYLDGNSNRGFSGGPVVFFIGTNYDSLSIMGVISDYYSEQAFVKDVKQKKIVPINIGSGIVKAYAIKYALDAIAKKPEGPVIKK